MSHFWAEWDPNICPSHIIRKDTRVYYHPSSHQQRGGQCIGTFYLENPGSGRSSLGLAHVGWSPVVDVNGKPGDPTLQMVWDVWRCAQSLGKYVARPDDYIEVLNLYYFRSAASGSMLNTWVSHIGSSFYQPSICQNSQFVVAGWGAALNAHPLAKAAVTAIQTHIQTVPNARLLVPLLLALRPHVHVIVYALTLSAVTCPLTPYPLHPMGAANRGLKSLYIANVAASI